MEFLFINLTILALVDDPLDLVEAFFLGGIIAKKIEYIIQELALKVVNYNIMMGMTHAY